MEYFQFNEIDVHCYDPVPINNCSRLFTILTMVVAAKIGTPDGEVEEVLRAHSNTVVRISQQPERYGKRNRHHAHFINKIFQFLSRHKD